MKCLWTIAVTTLLVYVSVHGGAIGLVLSELLLSGRVVSEGSADLVDTDPSHEGDPDHGSDEPEDSPPPPLSELGEDDVKHCSPIEWPSFIGPDGRRAALQADELAHDLVHLGGLERPPRA